MRALTSGMPPLLTVDKLGTNVECRTDHCSWNTAAYSHTDTGHMWSTSLRRDSHRLRHTSHPVVL